MAEEDKSAESLLSRYALWYNRVIMAPKKSQPASKKSSKKVRQAPKSTRATSRRKSARNKNREFVVAELPGDIFPIKERSQGLFEWEPTEVDLTPALEANLRLHPKCRDLLKRYKEAHRSNTPVSLTVKADDLWAKAGGLLYQVDILTITAHGRVRLGWMTYPTRIARAPSDDEEEEEEEEEEKKEEEEKEEEKDEEKKKKKKKKKRKKKTPMLQSIAKECLRYLDQPYQAEGELGNPAARDEEVEIIPKPVVPVDQEVVVDTEGPSQ
uniref:Chromo domain-containing protein n=1 Tax=Caenorhabditis tropicalis TaxID=1561998 RepID=A0A1I7UF26_9PELO